MPPPPSAAPTYPLSLPDFETALRKGHGRAILTLQRVADTTPYRDAVRHACVNDLRFERQVENSREEYAADLALLCIHPASLADELIKELTQDNVEDNEGDWMHVETVTALARRGYPGAIEAIRQYISSTPLAERYNYGWTLIELFGLNGLLELAECAGDDVPEDDRQWVYSSWMDEAKDRFGRVQAMAALRHAATTSPRVAAFLPHAETWLRWELTPPAESQPQACTSEPWPEIWSEIEKAARDGSGFAPGLLRWARHATDEMLRQAAAQFLIEEDVPRLRNIAWVLKGKPWPLDIESLRGRFDHPDPTVAAISRRVARHTRSEVLRADALARLARGEVAKGTLDLLQSNYRSGDQKAIEHALFNAGLTDEEVHDVTHDIRNIFKDGDSAEAIALLQWAYEFTPCSFCRCSALRRLMKHGLAPAYIIEEAAFDANPETRKLALHGVKDDDE